MLQSGDGRLQSLQDGIQFCAELCITSSLIGMRCLGGFKVGSLQLGFIQRGTWWQAEQLEAVGHRRNQAAKLSPQEQVTTAFGFFTLKPPCWMSSL